MKRRMEPPPDSSWVEMEELGPTWPPGDITRWELWFGILLMVLGFALAVVAIVAVTP